VYHALLHQDGVHLPSPQTASPGSGTSARHVMRTDVTFLDADRSVEDAWRAAGAEGAPAFLVGSRDRLLGTITRAQLEAWRSAGKADEPLRSVIDGSFVHAHPDHPLDVVLERLAESDGLLPVVSRTGVQRVEGVITGDTLLGTKRFRAR
jgi:CBS domain-containing protein